MFNWKVIYKTQTWLSITARILPHTEYVCLKVFLHFLIGQRTTKLGCAYLKFSFQETKTIIGRNIPTNKLLEQTLISVGRAITKKILKINSSARERWRTRTFSEQLFLSQYVGVNHVSDVNWKGAFCFHSVFLHSSLSIFTVECSRRIICTLKIR